MIEEQPETTNINIATTDKEKDAVETAENFNAEGIFHQSQLGTRVKRKHFFAPLDPSSSDAVHRDAETVVFTEAEEKAVKRKIDLVVLPLVVCSYIFNQFDRTNIGNAHVIEAFDENYGITSNNKWTLALSIFYVGYCILEMPANVLQRHIGANRFFFLSLTFWGLSSLSIVYAKGYPALLVLRALMGIGEAGYYAGMIYYLSFWYKRHELAMRISLCMTGTLPGAIGGLLAFGLVRLHTSVLTGWQFLFLIEGIPTILMGTAILLFLPSFPFSASFLTPREKAIAQARLDRDHKPQSHGGMTGWEGFKAVLIKDLGFSSIDAQGMTVAPYAAGWFMVFTQAWHSDRTKDRGWHIMVGTAISTIGYVILATSVQKSVGAAYFALFLVVGGNYSLFPLVMSWAANTFSPTSKRGVGTAFIVSFSNCISIASPQIYFDSDDEYRKGHAISAACLFISFLATFILRMRLSMQNKKNQAILQTRTEETKEEMKEQDEQPLPSTEEIWDNDPRYVFMT